MYVILENYKPMLRINMKHGPVSPPCTQFSTKVPCEGLEWFLWKLFPDNHQVKDSQWAVPVPGRGWIKASLTELCIRVRMIQSIFSVCACKNRMQCSRWEWDHRNRYVSSIINLIRPSSAPALPLLLCIGLKCRVWRKVRNLANSSLRILFVAFFC